MAEGFIAAGPVEIGIQVKAGVDAARAKHGRADQDFGHTFVTLMSPSEDEAVAAAEKWRAAGGTHVSISSMGMGFGTSLDAHLDFIGRIADRLGVASP